MDVQSEVKHSCLLNQGCLLTESVCRFPARSYLPLLAVDTETPTVLVEIITVLVSPCGVTEWWEAFHSVLLMVLGNQRPRQSRLS